MPTMKAVRIHTYGGVDVLQYEDAPRPAIGEGEVLVRVFATSVNPFDCAVRAGYMAAYLNNRLPLILGTDFSGVVEAVGPGVTAFRSGDQVYGRGGVVRDGAYAEYAVVPESAVAKKPQALDHLHAAGLPHASLTAWQALSEHAKRAAGRTGFAVRGKGGVTAALALAARARRWLSKAS